MITNSNTTIVKTQTLKLKDAGLEVEIDTNSLFLRIRKEGNGIWYKVSDPIFVENEISEITKAESSELEWSIKSKGLSFRAFFQHNIFFVNVESSRDQKLIWPKREIGIVSSDYLVIPISQGLLIPVNDSWWRKFLADEGCLKAHENLSMPFFGHKIEKLTAVQILSSELHSKLCFENTHNTFKFKNEYTFDSKNNEKNYLIGMGLETDEILSSAKFYKKFLKARGSFKTLKTKIEKNKDAEKLLGAIHAYVYGDGRKEKSLLALQELGIDKMWIGWDQDERETGSWNPLVDKKYVLKAKSLGYLVGPYDTFDNIQHPKKADTPLSIYDLLLYKTGGILLKDGKRKKGFGGRGHELSSEALRKTQFFEKRILKNQKMGINSYFLDVDAYGNFNDDYDPNHLMNKSTDRDNKRYRLEYVFDRLVLGSENPVSWSVSFIHFGHGPQTIHSNLFFSRLSNKEYFGGWSPTQRPAIFFKEIEADLDFYKGNFDSKFKVPLYESVFHEAVVSTPRWEMTPVKFTNHRKEREILNLLYSSPEIWALDFKQIEKYGERIKRNFNFFSPLHKALAHSSLKNFQWLDSNGKIQKTTWSNGYSLTANFSNKKFGNLRPFCIELSMKKRKIDEYCAF